MLADLGMPVKKIMMQMRKKKLKTLRLTRKARSIATQLYVANHKKTSITCVFERLRKTKPKLKRLRQRQDLSQPRLGKRPKLRHSCNNLS